MSFPKEIVVQEKDGKTFGEVRVNQDPTTAEQPDGAEAKKEAKTPVVEAAKPIEEAKKTDDVSIIPESKKEVIEPMNDEAFNKMIAELTGGKATSKETLQKLANSTMFDDNDKAEIARYNFIKSGGKGSDFDKIHSVDLNKATPLEIAILKFKIDNPKISDEKVRLLVEDEYGQGKWDGELSKEDFEDLTESEQKMYLREKATFDRKQATGEAKLEVAVEKFKSDLEKQRSEMTSVQPEERAKESVAKELIKAKTAWGKKVEDSLPMLSKLEFKGMKIGIPDGKGVQKQEDLSYVFPKESIDEARNYVKDFLTNTESSTVLALMNAPKYTTEKGIAELMEDALWTNPKTRANLIQFFIDKGVNSATEGILSKVKPTAANRQNGNQGSPAHYATRAEALQNAKPIKF